MKINELLTEGAFDKVVDTVKKAFTPSNPVKDMRDKVQNGEVKDAGKDSVFQKMSDRNKDMKQALDTVNNESSKIKGADGKACWDGYRYNGTKDGKDSCVKEEKSQRMDPSKVTQAVPELHAALMANKTKIHRVKTDKKKVYKIIDGLMQSIALAHDITGQKLHDMWVKKYKEIPDTWILNK
jgi:hypothetical protein